MVKIKDLMTIERILLEIYTKHKFDLDFNTSYKLYNYLRVIGRITNYSFQIQEEYFQTIKDEEKMKAFHEKILNGEVEYDWIETTTFIDKVVDELNNDEINKIVNNLRFWY